ncbi:hypothetical protein EXIGLDRAFT_724517 [Exidia glandulosa HHB12029]|uniref:F-box domain-containing protein n=1 Tax=Exidia glandulosa HHB12029 TaxID=1314781 RepID=A0A165EDL6_EXIGL|nr:hypothetical protein EXIGLDRAFT_724517 [Exidia glandulosa HHB12029]
MSERDLTAALPPEIVRKFLWGWTLDDLLPVLRVSTRWREIGLNHPVYWQSIDCDDFTEGAIRFAFLRVGRTNGRPFSLAIFTVQSEYYIPLLLAVVSTHLHNIVALSIRVPGYHAESVFASLIRPAPQLHTLCIGFQPIDPVGKEPIAPDNLFAHHAPALRTVTLQNVRISRPLAVFANVQFVSFGSPPSTSTIVPCVFTHFPLARTVQFSYCGRLSLSQNAPDSFWFGLDSLVIEGGPDYLSDADIPLHGVRHLQLNLPGRAGPLEAEVMSSHLRGELDVEFVSRHEYNHISVFALNVIEREWKSPLSAPHNFLARSDIASRITTLAISADILPAVCELLLPMPNVLEATILFHYWGFSRDMPTNPLVVPKLRALTLEGDGDSDATIVPMSYLAELCRRAVVGYAQPLTIVVRRVFVQRCDQAVGTITSETLPILFAECTP